MKEAFLYVLLEKAYFVLDDLKTIAKVMKIAKNGARNAGRKNSNGNTAK